MHVMHQKIQSDWDSFPHNRNMKFILPLSCLCITVHIIEDVFNSYVHPFYESKFFTYMFDIVIISLL